MTQHPVPSAEAAATVMRHDIVVTAADGHVLAASLFEPARGGQAAAPVSIISAGAGIPRGYYRAFAEALAARGGPVLTYDYRGIGGALDRPLRSVTSRMSDWGRLDAPAMVRFARATWPGRPLHWIGHSYGGGFAVGLNPLNGEIDRHLGIAVPHGYWRQMDGRGRIGTAIGMGVVVPLLCHGLGYLPGRWLGLGEDLPKAIALEWRSWIMSPNSMWDTLPAALLNPYLTFRAPMCFLRPSDDQWASAVGTRRMADAFTSARESHVIDLDVRALGTGPVGHIGFFRARHATALWPLAFGWLSGELPRGAASV